MAYLMYIETVLFPITPGKVTTKINGNNKTFTLINEGEVNLIKSPGLTEISIDKLLLPAVQNYPFANRETENGEAAGFYKAQYYLNKLEEWKKRKKPVKWKLIRISPDGRSLLWDSSMDVTVEDYEIIEDAEAYGLDVAVKLKMKQYVYFGAKKLKIKEKKKKSKKKKKKTTAKKKKARVKKKAPEKGCTVKEGDSMLSISRTCLGDGARWREIYSLNRNTMDAWARKRGHKSAIEGLHCWIFPGEELKLPK